MLRTSRVHPKLSALRVLEGQRDFNKVPFGPPGTRATIFNPPETRGSFGPRAIDGWYVGPMRGLHTIRPMLLAQMNPLSLVG